MLWYTCLSLAEDNVTFPRMNYRRKKISMKERLEEAIEEIGDEPLQGSGSRVKGRKRVQQDRTWYSRTSPAARSSLPSERSVGMFEISRTGPEPTSAMSAKSRLLLIYWLQSR